jgi:hypothetical protein
VAVWTRQGWLRIGAGWRVLVSAAVDFMIL